MAGFKNSDACKEIVGFIQALQDAVKGTQMSKTEVTEGIKPLVAFLDDMSKWVDEVPPIAQPMRFGNKAFKIWMDKVMAVSSERLAELSTAPDFDKCLPEIKFYFEESFGSYERIDYGTGHELNFIVFMFCLFKIGVLGDGDMKATINVAFQSYIKLVRKLLGTYYLEPAGSHGVWGLDDY